MKLRRIAALFLSAVLLTGLLAGCVSQADLVGTWEMTTEASVAGEGMEEPITAVGTIRFTFNEDGSGAMETDFGSDVPATSDAFDYTLDGRQLTLNLPSRVETYKVKMKGDTLVLDGKYIDWELARQP